MKKRLLAILMAGLMLATIIGACFSASAILHQVESKDPTGGMGTTTFHAFYDKDRSRTQGSGEDDASGASVSIFFRKSITDSWERLVIFPRHTDSEGELRVQLAYGYMYQVQIYDRYWRYVKRNFGVPLSGIRIECPLIAPWWDCIENDQLDEPHELML